MVDKQVNRLPTPSLDGFVSNPSETPTKSYSAPSTNPQTPIPKKQKPNTDQGTVGYRMSLYGLMQDDDAFEEAADFKSYIEDIVTSERGSTMKDASVKRFRNHLKVYKWANEFTFLYQIIPLLQGYGYHIQGDPEAILEEKSHHSQESSEWREFLTDEKVLSFVDKNFSRTLLPSRLSGHPILIDELAKDLAKDKDMTNPRPDMVFGLQRDKHPLVTDAQIPQHILDRLEIVPGTQHVFLIIEGKSHSGSSATAENQARRGGATLVKASRTLRAIVERDIFTLPIEEVQELADGDGDGGSISKPQRKHPIIPDFKSFVFSVTVSPTNFSIWVHWFDEGNELYHMNQVESHALNNSKGPVQIRWALHNIIEFGVWTRREQNESLVKMIEDYARAYKQRGQKEPSAKSTGRGAASSSKKRSAPDGQQ